MGGRVTAELNEAHRLGNMPEVFRLVRVLGVKHGITRLMPEQEGVAVQRGNVRPGRNIFVCYRRGVMRRRTRFGTMLGW